MRHEADVLDDPLPGSPLCRPAVSTHPGFRFAAGERIPRQAGPGEGVTQEQP